MVLSVILFSIILLSFFSVFTVEQQTVEIIERLGKFNRTAEAGLNLKIPFFETRKGALSLRVQQIDVMIETKTKDNVFVKVIVSVQYQVMPQNVFTAFYKLTDATRQIESYLFDVVRAEVPRMTLDEVFEKKDHIATAIKNELSQQMADFGYDIIKALVVNIEPDANVKKAMNEINEQHRLRMAAQEKGEAEKILRVKHAEAEAESMKLQGIGIANQRKAIIDGLRQSIAEIQETIHNVSASDVLSLVMMAQYYDTLKEVGASSKSNVILLPHSPGNLRDITEQLREGIISGTLATRNDE